ncbi:MAG TPA: leucine--tRNA ligase [Clostridiaceae bacterium]|jgi:leucyl-tRNA synthetase|nr:leucine--tRNA ligase [Clostridiaceae bacterium]
MDRYDFSSIEKKWQKRWEETGVFHAEQPTAEHIPKKPKYYCLVEFPYPSGDGLHVGHPRSYTALDLVARKKRLEGMNVLYPMGWDAFGLPTENYAIAEKIHPSIVTRDNIARFKNQLQSLGFSFDWSREINTTDPDYYKWTQWIFLQFYKHSLAFKKEMAVNWCPSCLCVLANEEVVDGKCERCGAETTHKIKSQWMLKITEYAQKLLDGLNEIDFIDRVNTQQRNWIGRSEGAEIDFGSTAGDPITVYTTRPDTLWGATYAVMSPEHALLDKWINEGLIRNVEALTAYREEAQRKSEFERTELNKEKTGVCLEGVAAINPGTKEEIPLFISDYVLTTYGTGAIMAVPGHDDRDYEFAKVFDLPIVCVVEGGDISEAAYTDIEDGIIVNSGFIDGLSVREAIARVTEWLEEQGVGRRKVNYRLRDWVFSRQRYWGEPIPMIYCEQCGWQPVPEAELPLCLPEVESYEPTETGESPLAKLTDWVKTTCPVCGGPAERETDTMPNWAGSSWYFIRYTDPTCETAIASPEALNYWLPVDWYNGGMEHTTLHLLYSRFWHRFLYDKGIVPVKEPYLKRTSHGMILGEGGEKMSKSRGNVVNPDDIVKEYGADTLRLYEVFIGDFEKPAPWSTTSIRGCSRFLDRVWALQERVIGGKEYRADVETLMHQTIKKVTTDIDTLKGNTAVAQLMTLCNRFYEMKSVNNEEFKTFLLLLNPFTPHITEEIWERQGFPGVITDQTWPIYDEAKTIEQMVEIAIQVNGRIKARIDIAYDLGKEEALACAKAQEAVAKEIVGQSIVKEIYVPGRLINIVVKK